MSFLSGSTKRLPQPAPKVAGLDENKTSTAEQARPVPWLCGRQRIGVTFLSQAFDQIAEEVTEEVSKKEDEITTGYNYFCSFAFLLCGGGERPVDTIEKIYLDEKEVWSGLLQRGVDGTDYVDITIEGHGEMRVYFGTATQDIDPTLATLAAVNSNGVIEHHSAYRGFCYGVAKRFFLGYQRTNVANIEFVVGRYPSPGGLPAVVLNDSNLAAAVAEAVTETRMGLGLPASVYDDAAFSAIGNVLEAENNGFSPFVTRRQPLRQVIVEMCETFDAFHFTTPIGKLALGLVRQNSSAVATYTEEAMAETPRINPNGYENTSNQVQLVYTNGARAWKEDVAIGDDIGNLQIVQEPRSVTLQRPWVTRAETAFAMAYAAARVFAQPEVTGVLTLRKSRLGALSAGKLFKFSYAQWGICYLLARCTELHWPDPNRPIVEVSFKMEAGRLNAQFSTPSVPETPGIIVGTTEPFDYEAILELPALPESAAKPQIGWLQFLAARPNLQTSRFKAHIEREPDSFEPVFTATRFAWRAVIDAEFAGDGSTIDEAGIQFTILSLEKTLPAMTMDDATRNRLLMWIGPGVAAADSQFVSLFDLELQLDGSYKAKTIRGRLDTRPKAIAPGTAVWILARGSIEAYSITSEATTQVYKLQPIVYGQGLPLEDATELSVTVNRRALRPWRPANVRAFGMRFKPWFTSGQNISVSWDIAAVERGAFFSSFGAGYTENLPSTELTFSPVDGVGTPFSVTLAPGVTTYNLTNASLVTNFGAQKSVKIAARHMRNNLTSLQPEELVVTLNPPTS